MKIQTQAVLKSCSIDGNPIDLPDIHPIELEFSAVDTGGGFRDAILDFSFLISMQDGIHIQEIGDRCEVEVTMQNPKDAERTATFSYLSAPALTGKGELEVNGRLKEDKLSREVVGFMLYLLR